MKYFTYLAISIMAIAVISLFYLKKPDGQTWLSASSISSESGQIKERMVALSSNTLDQAVLGVKQAGDKIASSISDEPIAANATSSGKIYKWQDETGQWHFSDTPNPHAKSIEVKLDPKDITVIAAEDTSILNTSSTPNTMSAAPEGISILNPDSVKKLFNDAENVKDKLEKRNKEINNLSAL
ncbi:DUF4124 domain-containing protein [Pseudoalteromonas distincta]|uniref:DUF4124 domain-containing protein n=1 Tax=Pseudoalteromonas distincta TaxID=77608 RepID=A0A4V1HDT7_9GAMM|nr:DUF4124 domain-containing protein [Pseudoalteromonas distincta]MDC3212768.1 DUF4124 domain-containing protein [Pseudoalteromonas distincta]QCU75915.1 DUF4124 domain-containing protein [Pseudoalteromonas distincta]